MLALRRRSKSRGRSNSRGRLKKSSSSELAGVPTIITICNDDADIDEKIQIEDSKRVKHGKRSRSRKRRTTRKNSKENLLEDEVLQKYERSENTEAVDQRHNTVIPLESKDISSSSPLAINRKHIRIEKNKRSARKDRSNSYKSTISPIGSILSFKSEDNLEQNDSEVNHSDTRNQLREQLMKECMGAIDRRQKQARELSSINVDEQKSRKDFDNVLKQSIKQKVTRIPAERRKSNEFRSNRLRHLGGDGHPAVVRTSSDEIRNTREGESTTEDQEKYPTITVVSDDTSCEMVSEEESSRKCKRDNSKKSPHSRNYTKRMNSLTSDRSNSLKSTMILSGSEHSLSKPHSKKTTSSTSDRSKMTLSGSEHSLSRQRTKKTAYSTSDRSKTTLSGSEHSLSKHRTKKTAYSTSDRSSSLKSKMTLSGSEHSLSKQNRHNNKWITSTNHNELESKSSPPLSKKQGREKNKKHAPENSNKLSATTLTDLLDETSNHSDSRINSPQIDQSDDPSESDQMSPNNTSGWRKTVSSIIAVRRKRSKSRTRSKSLTRSNNRTQPPRKSLSWGSKPSGKRSHAKKEPAQNVDIYESQTSPDNCIDVDVDADPDLKWHYPIMQHDWEGIKRMLLSYDHTKYRQRSNSIGRLRYPKASHEVSPLLQVDVNGRTPLHLAIREHMPSRQLRRLLFVERNAASIQDNEGRYPLHLVVLNGLDKHFLDRVIHACPDSLGAPDLLNRTPIQYSIMKAERSRENKEVIWGPPTTNEQAELQNRLTDAYQSVSFILESMIKRHKVMSSVHESQTLIDSAEIFAPPEVVDMMVKLSVNILYKDLEMCERIVDLVFENNYPLNVIHRVLEITSKIIPPDELLETIRQRLTDHFTEGCNGKESRGTAFAKQFAKSCQKGGRHETTISSACKSWWDKLRYLIARSSNQSNNGKNDTVLHTALYNPKSQPAMIEYICRLYPDVRYKYDDFSDALPIHLACMYWHPERYGIGSVKAHKKVLNLLLAGDFDIVRRGCHGRIALHYAALNGKSMTYIQSLLNLNQETTLSRDPVTKLLPFQLAATSEKYQVEKPVEHLDVVYSLLRANPRVLCTYESVDPESQKNALTRHVLKWCYDIVPRGKGMKGKLNSNRRNLLRQAIKLIYIPDEMKKWFLALKELIWQAYERQKGSSWDSQRREKYFLHATLWNSSHIPPIAIELISALYSTAIHRKEPDTGFYPLQIAAQVETYNPLSFEKNLSNGSALEMITLLYSRALRMKTSEGKLPLHIAIESGKKWNDLEVMINKAPETLSIPDSSTGLYPFQMAACGSSAVSKNKDICAHMTKQKSKFTSTEENAHKLSSLRKMYELEMLTNTFGLLKANPLAIELSRYALAASTHELVEIPL